MTLHSHGRTRTSDHPPPPSFSGPALRDRMLAARIHPLLSAPPMDSDWETQATLQVGGSLLRLLLEGLVRLVYPKLPVLLPLLALFLPPVYLKLLLGLVVTVALLWLGQQAAGSASGSEPALADPPHPRI